MIFIVAPTKQHADYYAKQEKLRPSEYLYVANLDKLMGMREMEVWVTPSWHSMSAKMQIELKSILNHADAKVRWMIEE